MGNRRLDSLTGLKGICITVIVLYHTLMLSPQMGNIWLLSGIKKYGGFFGNYMFFMLSGFLIAYAYKERIISKEIDIETYVFRRLKKIYPLYIVTNTIMLVIQIMQKGINVFNIKSLLFVVFMQKGGGLENSFPYNNPTWFVGALFICYILYYIMTYYTEPRVGYKVVIVIGIIWGYILLISNWALPFCYVQNGEAFLNFFVGCLLAEIYEHTREKKIYMFMSVFALVIVGVLMRIYGVETIAGDLRIALSFFVCPLLIYVCIECKLLKKLLEWQPIKIWGEISLSVFYWHYVIYVIYTNALKQTGNSILMYGVQYFVYLIILILVSFISHFIEKKLNVKYNEAILRK